MSEVIHGPAFNDNRLFNYSRSPCMILSIKGFIQGMNIACRELFAPVSIGCDGIHYSEWEKQILLAQGERLLPERGMCVKFSETSSTSDELLCETSDLSVARHEITYCSTRFGEMRLVVNELPYIHAESGMCIGSLVSFENHESSVGSRFHEAIDRALNHAIMWDMYAASYDRVLGELFFYQEALARHCNALANPGIVRVLDVGSGTGFQAERLLKAGKQVTAVDISSAMLQRLRAKIERLDAASRRRIVIIEDSAERLPQLADNSFDAATILLSFFDMQNPLAALREVQRLVVPGGLIVLTEPRACFNVEKLMAAGKNFLIENGKMNTLADDWRRIETIAPLIRDRIISEKPLLQTNIAKVQWNVERIYDILKAEGYEQLTIADSHVGNCAFVTARKPLIGEKERK